MQEIFDYQKSLDICKNTIDHTVDEFFSTIDDLKEMGDTGIKLLKKNECKDGKFKLLYHQFLRLDIANLDDLICEWTRQVIKYEAQRIMHFWSLFTVMEVESEPTDPFILNSKRRANLKIGKSLIRDFAKTIVDETHMKKTAIYEHAYDHQLTMLFATTFFEKYLDEKQMSFNRGILN